MNEIKSFTFYKNYYELLDNLSTEDKRLMLEVIVDYIFRDVEPIGLEKMNLAIWNNIKMPIDTSKKQALNGLKGGRPKENIKSQTETQKETQTKANEKTNNISTFYFLISNFNFYKDRGLLRGKIEEWLKYKWEKKEFYKETGFKSLLKQIEKQVETYGEEAVIEVIDESMANNWKGIIFDKLKKQPSAKIKNQKSGMEKFNAALDEWERKMEEQERNDNQRHP